MTYIKDEKIGLEASIKYASVFEEKMDLSISLLNILFSVIPTTSKQMNGLNHYDVEVLYKILHAFFL